MSGWKLFSRWGSLRSGDPDTSEAAFHAGHVNDIIRLNVPPYFPVLVGSATSGVWLANEGGGIALPLGWDWEFPRINCLCIGVHGNQHAYAAGEVLYETDTTTTAPLFNWRRIQVRVEDRFVRPGQIYRIVVLHERGTIVLATEGGIFWSKIPQPGGGYTFTRADLPGTSYSGLAATVDDGVVVGAFGSDLRSHYGIFVGSWTTTGDLTFRPASIVGNIDISRMLRTEIAACATDLTRLYAVCSGGGGLTPIVDQHGNYSYDSFGNVLWNGDELIYKVLASKDGGATWNVTGNAINGSQAKLFGGSTDVVGHTQAGYNLCIGVSPFDPSLVAIGVGCPAISKNAGKDWDLLALALSPHLHTDIHAVVFDQTDPAHQRLLICSDGGLASTPDLGRTFASGANRQLPNFQFTRFGASSQFSGLVGGSLQDNGNVYTTLYIDPVPWTDLDGGDGVLMMFPQSGNLVRLNNTLTLAVGGVPVEFGAKARISSWDSVAQTWTDLKLLPKAPLSWGVIPVDASGDGLTLPVTEAVEAPAWANASGQPMLAVAATTETIFGLFGDGNGGFAWNQLTTVPHEPDTDQAGNELPYFVTAVASHDGNIILVGMNNGKLFKLDASAWVATDMTIAGNTSQLVRLLVGVATGFLFAVTNQQAFQFDGTSWTDVTPTNPAPVDGLVAIAADHTSPHQGLFLASSSNVWASQDNGTTWYDFGGDLPRAPQIQDLRYATEGSGASFLYLSTFGWSAFRRLLNFDDVLKPVTVTGHMDIVDRVAFGHDLWTHPKIMNVLQLGPQHPLESAEYTEDDGDEIRVIFKLKFEWHIDFSVVVRYDATLIALDEDNYLDDHKYGTFTVLFGSKHREVLDLASDEHWPDRAHIDFTVANP